MKFYLFETELQRITVAQFATSCKQTATFVCWEKTINYFIEYALSLQVFSFLITFDDNDLDYLIRFTNLHENCFFVFPTNIHNDFILQCALQTNCCLFNSEQMTIADRRAKVVAFLKQGGRCINYSTANVDLLAADVNVRNSIILPYICCENERSLLHDILERTEKKFDFAIVCSLTPRRRRIIDELQRRNITLCVISDCFGAARDQKIAQCRALLNIHASENYTIYESIRCNRWLAAGLKVVCEKSSDNTITVPAPENVYFVDSEHLVEFCVTFTKSIVTATKHDNVIAEQISGKESLSISTIARWSGIDLQKRKVTPNQISFLYGAADCCIDVTNTASTVFKGQWLIPAALSFNNIFGDVWPGVEKHLLITYGDMLLMLPEKRLETYTVTLVDERLILSKIKIKE